MKGCCDFNRVQILPLNVLNQRELQQAIAIHRPNKRGNLRQASQPRGAPTSFPGNNPVSIIVVPIDNDRLQDSVNTDGLRKFADFVAVENVARLLFPGLDFVERLYCETLRSSPAAPVLAGGCGSCWCWRGLMFGRRRWP